LKLSRWTWLTLAGLIVLAVLSLGLFSGWSRYRLRQDLARVVAEEEAAALAGDGDKLQQLTDPGAPDYWLALRLGLAQTGRAAPLPLPLLRPVRQAGVVRSVETLAQNMARVGVARQFTAPDGAVVTFALPQFYQFSNGTWRRIPPPDQQSLERRRHSGPHVEIGYEVGDAAFVEKNLAPYVDDVLARACAKWDCPATFKIGLNLVHSTTGASFWDYPSPLPGDPWLFALSPPQFTRWPGNILNLPSSQSVGYPVDDASTDLFKRAIALQALFVAADQLVFYEGGQDQAQNGFLYALVARMAAQLGLELPEVDDILSTPEAHASIWNSGPDIPPPTALHSALAVLNWLLRDQPPDAETRLLRALRQATGPEEWLALGLGLSPEAAGAKLRAAIESTYQAELNYRVAELPFDSYDFALGCENGPALFSLDSAQPYYLLPDYRSEAYLLSRSRDGTQLALMLRDQPVILDLSARKLYALPGATRENLAKLQWITDTVVAYI
ncbi:MAG: hypothetical protein ACRDH2_16340, partial [Anaerolineales bacterium]